MWPNILCGAILPVGLFLYFRIWIFRRRLYKDTMNIIGLNKETIETIKTSL